MKASRNHGSRSCANWIRRAPGGAPGSSAGLHGKVRRHHGVRIFTANGRLDVLDAPRDAGRAMLELGMRGSALHRKYKIYLDHVGVAHVPEDYEDRLTEIFPGTFRRLRLLALDPYDLALSKLERNIQRDRDDVLHLARTAPLDLEVLKDRYQKELRWQLGNPEREDLTLQLWIDASEEERSKQ
jgi:hypothetical protein